MKKALILSSVLLLSNTLFSQDINIKNGWQLVGAVEDVNVSKFDNGCVDFIWKYDNTDGLNPQWRLHVANGAHYNYSGATIASLNKGEGFWVKGNGECKVNLSLSGGDASFVFTTDWLNGKSLYYVGFNDFGYNEMKWNVAKLGFTNTSASWTEYDTPNTNFSSLNYSITPDGFITFENEHFQIAKPYLKTDTYIQICMNYACDTSNNLEKEYFYFDEQAALNFRDAQNAEILANSEMVTLSGQVTFKDVNGNTIEVPSDAGIEILSDTDIENHNWGNVFAVGINGDGTFSKTKNMYLNSYKEGHTFQVVVFKNHIETELMSWNCGENTYKYVSYDATFGSWNNIVVSPNDFKDRSQETCSN